MKTSNKLEQFKQQKTVKILNGKQSCKVQAGGLAILIIGFQNNEESEKED